MSRRFVLVTASVSNGWSKDQAAAGIKKLKRGVTLKEFVDEFVRTVGADIIIPRDDSFTAIKRTDRTYSWTFTEYHEDELFSAVAHLSKEEVLRDLNELLPLKGMA